MAKKQAQPTADIKAAAAPKETEAEPTPPQSPNKASNRASKSSSSVALPAIVSLLVVFAAVLVSPSDKLDQIVPGLGRVPQKLTTTWNSLSNRALTAMGKTPDKYKTDLVDVEPRVLLSNTQCDDESYMPTPLLGGRILPVTDAMDVPKVGSDKVFFMLNGRNEGVYMSWNGRFECLAGAAEAAAKWLGADTDEIDNGVRLYTPMGKAIRDAAELSGAKNMAHILLDFQLWQWPGIKLGYKYVLEDGVELTTVGLTPKVFDVKYFFSESEAQAIMDHGMPALNRSKVDGANESVVSKSRTSHTAFLKDIEFTRDFRRRSAHVARLPSPSFAERLQLVRYGAGEFYRQHLDTFHSREFLPKGANLFTMEDYKTWTEWAAAKLREMDQGKLPEEFREGGKLFPNADDDTEFPNAFMDLFYHDAKAKNTFMALSDEEWATWIRTNVDKNASGVMTSIMKDTNKPHYLPLAVRVWEDKLGLPELHYTFPKKPVNGVSHYFRWVRWAKERVTYLGDQAPAIARPTGELYPKFTVAFQRVLVNIILDDYSEDFVTRVLNKEWYDWVKTNRKSNHVLFQAMQSFPHFAELAIRAWEKRVGSPLFQYKLPKFVRHFHPQRYVTLFLYLNNQTKVGGETVFPFSTERFSEEKIERTGMNECSTGLAVPPRGLHASLFYVQTPEGEVDKMSKHGGCPPHEGVKWGSNSFMWDSDADEGADLWTTK
ncbi:hypothetical protein Poli38472_002734 [Pythium oligandrum]|uniref:Prolyl 4-hydroxylase alpha subunit domain-containing protein n=1 Tax=Pythium oligandrum TaxID=41045 RepID=A0A8K1FMM0_PYTOL|nr:hypothetical protein Poli38472_002734 [Pythium oligandrum]|eukprot:TMW63793.1 hypothetical protein Poli38472_002734 [Pythium oligandrum]